MSGVWVVGRYLGSYRADSLDALGAQYQARLELGGICNNYMHISVHILFAYVYYQNAVFIVDLTMVFCSLTPIT